MNKLKLYGNGHQGHFHYFIFESSNRFFPLFKKFLSTFKKRYSSYFLFIDEIFGEDWEKIDVEELEDSFFEYIRVLDPLISIIFLPNRILLQFHDEEDKDELEKAIKFDMVG